MNILLTGTRAPATLDLARRLAREGHRVFGADSLRFPLGRFSNAFRRHVRIPAPNTDSKAFAEGLEELIRGERIDVLWPTCEEVFHVAAHHARLSATGALVLTPPLDVIEPLHHKFAFVRFVEGLGGEVLAPASVPAIDGGLEPPLMWKPYYSRFASRTRFSSPPPDPNGWVAQRLITGRELSSWSLCIEGQVRISSFYRCPVRSGRGAGCSFHPVRSPAAERFVESVAARLGYTGSLAFDFIEDASGKIWVIECNPRLTSGIHLLGSEVRISAALERRVHCPRLKPAEIRLAVLLARPLLAGRSRDVIFSTADPGPALLQLAGIAEMAAVAARHGIPLLAATTRDIEFNGR